jgi:UDP-N-acetylglucosamine 2-epimerase (non-hydrolysing)
LFGLWDKVVSTPNLVLMRPIGYHDMLRLNMTARLIISDSGGIQGESIALGVKCLILRNNTEWVVTLKENGGSSVLVGNSPDNIRKEYRKALNEEFSGEVPQLWDGQTADRCLQQILEHR